MESDGGFRCHSIVLHAQDLLLPAVFDEEHAVLLPHTQIRRDLDVTFRVATTHFAILDKIIKITLNLMIFNK